MLHSAENPLVKALPKTAKAAHIGGVSDAFGITCNLTSNFSPLDLVTRRRHRHAAQPGHSKRGESKRAAHRRRNHAGWLNPRRIAQQRLKLITSKDFSGIERVCSLGPGETDQATPTELAVEKCLESLPWSVHPFAWANRDGLTANLPYKRCRELPANSTELDFATA